MTITIPSLLSAAISEQARQQGVSPESLAIEAIKDRYLSKVPPVVPQDEWERKLFEAASDCGVSLSNEALSSEGLYD